MLSLCSSAGSKSRERTEREREREKTAIQAHEHIDNHTSNIRDIRKEGGRERDKKREREKGREGNRERQREAERDREGQRGTERQAEKEKEKEKENSRGIERPREELSVVRLPRVFHVVVLLLMIVFCVYEHVRVRPPQRLSASWAVLLVVVVFFCRE